MFKLTDNLHEQANYIDIVTFFPFAWNLRNVCSCSGENILAFSYQSFKVAKQGYSDIRLQ